MVEEAGENFRKKVKKISKIMMMKNDQQLIILSINSVHQSCKTKNLVVSACNKVNNSLTCTQNTS